MRIRMDDVTPGMKLETPIVKNDVILVKAGEVLTPHMINRLKNTFYIEELNIVSENQIQERHEDDQAGSQGRIQEPGR